MIDLVVRFCQCSFDRAAFGQDIARRKKAMPANGGWIMCQHRVLGSRLADVEGLFVPVTVAYLAAAIAFALLTTNFTG